MSQRIFIGTFLSVAEQQRLGELRQFDDLLSAAWQCKIRWLSPEKLHLTWFFIGKVTPEDLPEINAICADAAAQFTPMQLQFQVPTFWPAARGARMLVLRPETVPPEVYELGACIKSRCAKFAEHEDKKYRPHITLMRFGELDAVPKLVVPDEFPIKDYLPVPLDVRAISVIQSHMGTDGSYQSLSDHPLMAR